MLMHTVDEVAARVGRSRWAVHYHIRQLGLGVLRGHVRFLTEKEAKLIENKINENREAHDRQIESKRAANRKKAPARQPDAVPQ